MSVDLFSAQKGIGEKLDGTDKLRIIEQMFNLFMTEGVYTQYDEYIHLLEAKMELYNIKWQDINEIMEEEEAQRYGFDIKDYFEALINDMAINYDRFKSAAWKCMNFTKSIHPKYY